MVYSSAYAGAQLWKYSLCMAIAAMLLLSCVPYQDNTYFPQHMVLHFSETSPSINNLERFGMK